MMSVAYPGERTDCRDDQGEVGDRAHYEYRVGLDVAIYPVSNNLQQQPGNSRDSAPAVNTAEMLKDSLERRVCTEE